MNKMVLGLDGKRKEEGVSKNKCRCLGKLKYISKSGGGKGEGGLERYI